jgi:hypothetical protein
MNDELPPALKRDASNVAPFMLRAARAKALDELIAADAELLDLDANNVAPFMREVVSVQAAVLSRHLKEQEAEMAALSPATSPPASPPNWVPPWESKS